MCAKWTATVVVLLGALGAAGARAQQPGAAPSGVSADSDRQGAAERRADVVVWIAFDAPLAKLALLLRKNLNIRLARYSYNKGRFTVDTAMVQPAHPPDTRSGDWVVELRRVGTNNAIVAISAADSAVGVSEIRAASLQQDAEELAWTLALVVEDVVSPMLDEAEMAALGTGLAVIEPAVIGGVSADDKRVTASKTRLESVALGLGMAGVWTAADIIAGPRAEIAARLAARLTLAAAMGWMGRAEFFTGGVSGHVSWIPVDVTLGYYFHKSSALAILGMTGMSVGFAVYKTAAGGASRADMTFVPGVHVAAEIRGRVRGPWMLFVQTAVAFPFVRDVLENRGREVYIHPWVEPALRFGIRFVF